MRTTVTLDHDAELLLKQAMQQTGESFKATLNRAIRRGLADTLSEATEAPFFVEAKALGTSAGVDLAKLQELNDELDVEAFLEVTRKLSGRRPKGSA